MSARLISTTDIPTIGGDPAALSEAATDVDDASTSVTDAAEGVVTAWAGLTDENYDTPEAPGVKQSIPKITSPAETISTNLTSISTAISTASTTLTTLKTRRSTLWDDVVAFRTEALASDAEDEGSGVTGWRADPLLVTRNNGLWTRAGTLETDLEQVETDLIADLAGISAPDPYLPTPSWTAGVDAGSHAEIAGPGASTFTWSGSHYANGNQYWGAGAEAEAHLFQANATGRWDNGAWGTGEAGASFEIGAKADARANASIGVDGVHGQASASARAGAYGNANVKHEIGTYTFGADAKAMAGAEAEAKAGLDIGLDGVHANAGVEAFAGAKAEVSGSVENMGVTSKVGADVRAGIGVEAKADLAVTSEEVRVKLDLGVALGVGAGVNIDLSFKPKELVEDVKDLWPF